MHSFVKEQGAVYDVQSEEKIHIDRRIEHGTQTKDRF